MFDAICEKLAYYGNADIFNEVPEAARGSVK
jgi:hypothetical protein